MLKEAGVKKRNEIYLGFVVDRKDFMEGVLLDVDF